MKEDKLEDEVTLFDDAARERFKRLTDDQAVDLERITDEPPQDSIAPPRRINAPADDAGNRPRLRPRIL